MEHEKSFPVGVTVHVYLPSGSFHGIVTEKRPGWLRIGGQGSIIGSRYDELFSLTAKKVLLTRA